jgi:hypothetical protein
MGIESPKRLQLQFGYNGIPRIVKWSTRKFQVWIIFIIRCHDSPLLNFRNLDEGLHSQFLRIGKQIFSLLPDALNSSIR